MINVIRTSLAVLLFPLTIFQQVKENKDIKRINPLGRFYQIGNHTLHVNVQGNGKHTVVFDSGLGSFSLDWTHIQQELITDAVTVSYDRAGYGWSQRANRNTTSKECVGDLRQLLREAGLKPPYLMVGHSFGGLNMRLYAQMYPDEVSGLILIDPTSEYRFLPEYTDSERRGQYFGALRQYKMGYALSIIGMTRMFKRPVWNRYLSKNYIALGFRKSAYEAIYKEYKNIEVSCREVATQNLVDRIPVTILSAGKMNDSWKSDQKKLAKLFSNSRHIFIEDSYHNIHFERPDTVSNAIREMIDLQVIREGINFT